MDEGWQREVYLYEPCDRRPRALRDVEEGESEHDGAQGDLYGARRRVCRRDGRASVHGEGWGSGARADGPEEGGLYPPRVDA